MDKTKDTLITVRVTKSQREYIKQQASSEGLSVANSVRKHFNLLPPA